MESVGTRGCSWGCSWLTYLRVDLGKVGADLRGLEVGVGHKLAVEASQAAGAGAGAKDEGTGQVAEHAHVLEVVVLT